MNGIQANQTAPVTRRQAPIPQQPIVAPTDDIFGEKLSLTQAAEMELNNPSEFTARDHTENGAKVVKFGGTVLAGMKALGTKAGFLGSLVSIPDDAKKASDLVAQAGQTGDAGDINRAVGGVSYATSTAAKGAKAGLETATLIRDSKFAQHRRASAAATQAFKGAVPKASRRVAAAAGRQAALTAATQAKPNKVATAATKAAQAAGKGNLARATGSASNTAAKTLLRQGGGAAGKAAAQSLTKSAALRTAGKIGGRFIPGVNIGIAALDSAAFASTLADPKSSWAKKGIRGLTAACSIAAATNIPIVSQVAGVASAASSIVDGFIKN